MAGPGLGGVLVQLIGALPTLGVTAVGSLLSAVSLARVPECFTPAVHPKKSTARDLLEGLRFLRRDRVLAGLLGFSAISNPFAQWIMLLFLVDAVRRLHLTTGQIGGVLAIGAVGTLLGAVTAPAVAHRLGALRTILGHRDGGSARPLRPPGSGAQWGGSAAHLCPRERLRRQRILRRRDTVVVTTVRQTRIPDDLRGRVNATTRMVSYGTITLGAAVGGLAGQLCGVRLGLLLGCLGALTTVAWVTGWATRLTRASERLDDTATGRGQRVDARPAE